MAVTEEDLRQALPGDDDISGQYIEHRQTLAQLTAAEELLGRVNAARVRDTQQLPEDELTREAVQRGQIPAERTLAGQAQQSRGRAIAGDIARGIVEAPRAIVAGARDAVQATLDFLQEELPSMLEERIPLGGLQIIDPETRRLDIRYVRPDELDEQTIAKLNLPDIRDPRSQTGQMVKGVSQFLVGLAGAGKIKALKRLSGMGTAGKVAAATVKGMLADFAAFDPDERRLSDLIQRFPELQNPVTEYLASDPNDSDAESRFKRALEGAPLGLLTDAFAAGVRAIRAIRHARAAADAGEASAAGTIRQLRERALDILGDPDLPPIVKRAELEQRIASEAPSAAERVARGAEATAGMEPATIADAATARKLEGETFINFARIDTPDDVKAAMQAMADGFALDIDAARRGVQTFRDIELAADQINAWETLMSRRVGEPLNAEQSLAARRLWVSSAEKLTALAQNAADNPNEANLFAFRKMLATHYAIQREVIGARTETARALAQWRIPAGSSAERLRAIDSILENTGGAEASRELAKRIAALAGAPGLARELEEVVEKSVYARTRDAVIEAWIMGLLWGPKTHLVNIMSNTSVLGMQIYERATAARIAQLLGDEGSVQLGEATAQWFGLVSGLKDAFRYAWKSAKTGESGLGIGKIDAPQVGAISSEALVISSSSWLGRAVDGIGNIWRIPGRALAAEDEFFKTIGYRMELYAQAMRQARSEVLAGKLAPEELKSRIADIVANPPPHIRTAAVDQALYQTFTSGAGTFAGSLSRIANDYPLVRILLPFVRTPANIMKFTFERTPLAPLMSQVRADIAAGGARRDLALARMATGSAVLLVAAELVLSGVVTGGGPAAMTERQALARTGWQPYSVLVDGKYIAYNRLDPLGMILGIAADMTEILANNDEWTQGAGPDEVAIAAAAAIGNNVMSKTYLSGVADFFEAMSDPRRYSETWAQRLAGSTIPANVAEIRRIQDPYMREVRSMLDALRNRTPLLSEGLPVSRDLWGRPREYRSPIGAMFDLLSPIYVKMHDPEPVDQEILSGGLYSRALAEGREFTEEEAAQSLPFNVAMPPRQTSFDGVSVDLDKYPGAYSRYLELAGNELKHPAWGLGAKDFLNAVISGRHPMSEVYAIRSDGPDGGKEVFIRDTINDYRQRARRQLLEEFPELRREVEEKQARRRELRLPVMR